MRPAKIQISLRIGAVWSESSLGVFLITKDAMRLHADSEDSGQIARLMYVVSRRGSYINCRLSCQNSNGYVIKGYKNVVYLLG